jgi:conjugal transfer/type IV secretion protein DotA/TraY
MTSMFGRAGRALLGGLLALCLLAALPAMAQTTPTPTPIETANFFGTETGDPFTSIFLNQLFGKLFPAVNGTNTETVFSEIIGYFNVIMLVIGGLMFFWNVTVGILQTAHEGSILGQRWSSLWAPLRVIFAVGLLVPLPDMGGYNLAQSGVAYIVKGATNIASAVWSTSARMVIEGSSPISAQAATMDPQTVKAIYMISACQAVVNHQLQMASPATPMSVVGRTTVENGQHTFNTYINTGTQLVRPGICGSFITPELPPYISNATPDDGIAGIPSPLRDAIETRFTAAHHGSVRIVLCGTANLSAPCNGGFSKLVTDNLTTMRDTGAALPDLTTGISETFIAANTHIDANLDQLMRTAVGEDMLATEAKEELINRITGGCAPSDLSAAADAESTRCYGEGWIGAGSWYIMMAQLNNEIASLMSGKSVAYEGDYIEDIPGANRDIYLLSSGRVGARGSRPSETDRRMLASGMTSHEESAFILARYEEAFDDAASKLPSLGFSMSSQGLSDLTDSTNIDGILSYIPGLDSLLADTREQIILLFSPSSGGVDPMIGLINLGQILVNIAGVIMGIIALAAATPFVTISPTVATLLSPVLTILFTAGGALAYVLPLMPFIFWVMAVTGYFLLVIEAVIAVNLWALAHMRMDGDGISGEAGRNGWLMLLSLMMTPVLMVFGFLVGMGIFRVTSALLDIGINQAFSGLGGNLWVQLIGMMVYAILIVTMYIALLERSFSLVSEFPGRVLRWMNADARLTNGEEGNAKMAAGAAMLKVYSLSGGAGTGAAAVGSGAKRVSGLGRLENYMRRGKVKSGSEGDAKPQTSDKSTGPASTAG